MAVNRSPRAKIRKADKPKKSAPLPPELSDRLKHLATLPQNWDSYGAAPISPETISRVRSMLRQILAAGGDNPPLPFIAPASEGTIVLEWKTGRGKELILDVPHGDEPISFLLVEPQGPEAEKETEGVIGESWTLVEVIGRLLAR